jgi:hypothetical protein
MRIRVHLPAHDRIKALRCLTVASRLFRPELARPAADRKRLDVNVAPILREFPNFELGFLLVSTDENRRDGLVFFAAIRASVADGIGAFALALSANAGAPEAAITAMAPATARQDVNPTFSIRRPRPNRSKATHYRKAG